MTASRKRSRLARIEAEKARKSALVYTLLSIALIVFFVVFGITALPRIADVIGSFAGTETTNTPENGIPLPPPQLGPISEYTNEERITVRGFTSPGVSVIVLHNKERKEILSAADGTFQSTFTLEKGENTFVAFTTDNAGNESTRSRELAIVLDTEAPELEIVSPSDGQEFFGTNEQRQTIEGYTDSDARVTINGRVSVVRSDGGFRSNITLETGENSYEIKATDKAGNETVTKLSVSYSP